MQNAIINVNGTLLGPGAMANTGPDFIENGAKVSVFDRGYLYGDSLYEVVRSHQGQFIYLDEHLNRLASSAELCRMTLQQSLGHYKKEIYRTFKAFRARPGNQK